MKESDDGFNELPQNCRSKIVGEDRIGRPVLIAPKSTEQQLEELIRTDRKVTIDRMAIGCSQDLAYSQMHDSFEFPKIVCTAGPRVLTEEQQQQKNQKPFEWAFVFICLVHKNNILETNN
ncbi:hypothetical protein TNCV_932411 [Trichonephila clavipes]|nr:hypothetical protein TNCV_932411 [Trichonephila clavipes]